MHAAQRSAVEECSVCLEESYLLLGTYKVLLVCRSTSSS